MKTNNEIEKQMDKSLKNKEFDKFFAFFGQYDCSTSKDGSFYKTIALLYYLSLGKFEEYYALLQDSVDRHNEYEYILEVYESMRICDINAMEKLTKKADGSYRMLLENISNNMNKISEKACAINEIENKTVEQKIVKDINDCMFVLNNFKK